MEDEVTDQDLDDYEAEAGFELQFVSLEEAIHVNKNYKTDDYFNEIMIKRDTKLLEMIKENICKYGKDC